MQYKVINNKLIMVLEPNEELIESLYTVIKKENIYSGRITGIGATNSVEIGSYDTKLQQYISHHLQGEFEIVSLDGNITNMNGDPYLHVHIALGDADGNMLGGHLNLAYISVTCEIIIDIFDFEIYREYNEKMKLNIIKINHN